MARSISGVAAAALITLGLLGAPPTAGAATTTQLLLSQSAAFSILGHSCGGIQEQVYATGFGSDGYPTGDVYMQTRCGGSGRGGGYKTTTYSAWASVAWNWFGETRSFGRLEGTAEGISTSFSAEDTHGDRVYNVGTAAYLETTSPPLVAPAAPTGVTAAVSLVEVGEQLVMRFQVGWTPASETAGLITSSTVTAVPVGSNALTLQTTVSGTATGALVGPLQPNTTYRITVTNTDAEGTSEASAPVEAASPGEDGEEPAETLLAPEFGRCLKAPSEKEGTLTVYTGGFTTANCQEANAEHEGKYEWHRGAVRAGFVTSIKPTTTAKLETVGKAKVTCTGEYGAGAIAGPKTVAGMSITLTGCEAGGHKCTTAGLGEGELQTDELEGVLGQEKITFNAEGKEIRHIALALRPADGAGTFLEYACAGSAPAAIYGAVLGQISSGRMLTGASLKFAASGGHQNPEAFEGGVREVLTSSLGEQVGLTLATTLSSEEAVEVNPVV